MTGNIEFRFERSISAADLVPLLHQTDWASEREQGEVSELGIKRRGGTIQGQH